MIVLLNKRYTIHIYEPNRYAVDCEDCNGKVANMIPGRDCGEVMTVVNHHELTKHGEGS